MSKAPVKKKDTWVIYLSKFGQEFEYKKEYDAWKEWRKYHRYV